MHATLYVLNCSFGCMSMLCVFLWVKPLVAIIVVQICHPYLFDISDAVLMNFYVCWGFAISVAHWTLPPQGTNMCLHIWVGSLNHLMHMSSPLIQANYALIQVVNCLHHTVLHSLVNFVPSLECSFFHSSHHPITIIQPLIQHFEWFEHVLHVVVKSKHVLDMILEMIRLKKNPLAKLYVNPFLVRNVFFKATGSFDQCRY